MTTAGFVSGTRETAASSRCARAAAVSSFLLGAFLIAVLPSLSSAARYLGVLAVASALLCLGGSVWLWCRHSLLSRMVVALGALATGAGGLLLLLAGLPGTRGFDRPVALESAVGLLLALAVGVLLAVDGARQRPAHQPDHPYAL